MRTPTNEAEFRALFGSFTFTDLPGGSILITDKIWQKNIVKVYFGPKWIWAHRILKPTLEQIWADWEALKHPYRVTRVEAFVPRRQYWNPKYPLSIHSWGCALDVNPATNMPGMPGDLPPELVALFKANGFRWGGDYRKPDRTHFEFYKGKSF